MVKRVARDEVVREDDQGDCHADYGDPHYEDASSCVHLNYATYSPVHGEEDAMDDHDMDEKIACSSHNDGP